MASSCSSQPASPETSNRMDNVLKHLRWPTLSQKILLSRSTLNLGCPTLVAFLWRQGGHSLDKLANLHSWHYSHSLPLASRPLRFDLHHALDAREVMPKAAPRPILRSGVLAAQKLFISYREGSRGGVVTQLCPPCRQRKATRVGHPSRHSHRKAGPPAVWDHAIDLGHLQLLRAVADGLTMSGR